ncbi:endospore germination permease [Metabacillus fastidiosus]|uniref:endospore germination permease n=2 Tax=Metabacillus fastidiosus TaxID=1458 RepID=UPI002DB6611B|nr:endospore germination permease [Metabacillus fastidiosus]MEC2078370.1 endospore germination permease [Metabacillus fastidiosus]
MIKNGLIFSFQKEGDEKKMQEKDTITVFQMSLIIMMVIGLQNHVIVIRPLIQTAGRDGWMSVLITASITLVWGILILYIQKGMNQEHLYSWLKKQAGKPIAFILCLFIYIYCVILVTVTLKETITWTGITFLQHTPIIIPIIMMVILCILAALTSLRTIAITTFFLLFFVVIFGFFVAITNLQVKDYSLLLPMLENGYYPIIKGMVYPGAGMGELLILLFLQHRFSNKIRYRNIFWNIIILTILTIGPLIGGIIEFGPKEAGIQRFTAFEEWGLVSLGRYVEHLDFLSIYQWLSGAFIRITVLLLISIEIFSIKNKKLKLIPLFLISCTAMIAVASPISDFTFYRILKDYILPGTLGFCFLLSFVLALIVTRANIRKSEKRGPAS